MSSPMKRSILILCSFLAGLLVFPLAIYLYLAFGHPPVASSDKPFLFERQLAHIPLNARIHRDMPASSPFPASGQNLIVGAGIYQDKCEMCHGVQGEPSAMGRDMYPSAPQLWQKKKSGAVGVSDDPVGETYWKIKNGIRLTGMPAYGTVLSERELWQVSLLLSNADKPLPPEAAKMVGP